MGNIYNTKMVWGRNQHVCDYDFTIENYLEGSSYGIVSLTEIITLCCRSNTIHNLWVGRNDWSKCDAGLPWKECKD